jgi:hypothetical protein
MSKFFCTLNSKKNFFLTLHNMGKAKEQAAHDKEKHRTGDLIFELWGWVRIAASPIIIGLAIGFGIYASNPGTAGAIVAILIAIIGLIIGIIWATKVWKKKGTMNYISKIYESPDLDYLDEDNEKNINN